MITLFLGAFIFMLAALAASEAVLFVRDQVRASDQSKWIRIVSGAAVAGGTSAALYFVLSLAMQFL